eukprot:701679-Rhodomonas_salina.1
MVKCTSGESEIPMNVSTVYSTPTVPRSRPALFRSATSSRTTTALYCWIYGSSKPVKTTLDSFSMPENGPSMKSRGWSIFDNPAFPDVFSAPCPGTVARAEFLAEQEVEQSCRPVVLEEGGYAARCYLRGGAPSGELARLRVIVGRAARVLGWLEGVELGLGVGRVDSQGVSPAWGLGDVQSVEVVLSERIRDFDFPASRGQARWLKVDLIDLQPRCLHLELAGSRLSLPPVHFGVGVVRAEEVIPSQGML